MTLHKLKQAKDLKPGDVIDGKVIKEVRRFQFHQTRAAEQEIVKKMMTEGHTLEAACAELGLVEGTDWRWTG